MAIALVSSTAFTESNADLPTTTTFSHTCGSGSDRLLTVMVVVDQDTQLCTGITYAGVALTRACRITDSANIIAEVWYLKAPATGANNVVANWTNTTGDIARLVATDWTGVDQTTPTDTSATDFDTDGDEDTTYSYTTGVANALIVGCQSTDQDTTAGTPTTSWNEIEDTDLGGIRGLFGYRIVSGAAGAYTVGWTLPGVSSTLDSVLAMASFREASAVTTALQDPVLTGGVVPFDR